MFETNFTLFDWLIVAVYLTATVALGIWVNRHVHSAADYIVGGRSAGTSLSIASFIGTSLGLVTLMYAALEGFRNGLSYLFVPLVWRAATVFFGATGIVISRLREMRLLTIPEYFQHRFNRRVRIVAGSICALAGILNMGLFPKMGAIFITYATGLRNPDSPAPKMLGTFILGVTGHDPGDEAQMAELMVNLITTLLILLVLAYTVLGGMVAVIATDYVQFVVLSVGLGLGLWFCASSGQIGWDGATAALADRKGPGAFNPALADDYGWLYIVWMVLLASTAAVCWAPEASRALTTRDARTSRRMFLFGAPGFFARLAIPALWGIAAFAFISQDAQLQGHFFPLDDTLRDERATQAMPLLLGKIVPAGMLGVLVAGLLAAFMSTHDSYLLAWSSVISRDVVGPLTRRGELTDRQSILVTRISVVLIGVFLLVWGVWYELPASVWGYMAMTGTVYLAGAATVLIGGMYWRRASSTGATLALAGGLLALLGIFTGPMQRWVSGVSWGLEEADLTALDKQAIEQAASWLNQQTIGLATFAVCIVLFVAGSLKFPDRQETTVEEIDKGTSR